MRFHSKRENGWYEVKDGNGYHPAYKCERCGNEFSLENSGNIGAARYCISCAGIVAEEKRKARKKRYIEKLKKMREMGIDPDNILGQ